MTQRHSWIRILVFLLLFTTGFGARGQSANQKREADYQAVLRSYSDAIKPGATRKSVEDYFQTNGIKYQKMCCVAERSAYAELVRIGKEKHPWYCSEHNVYIAFQFVDEPHEGWRPSDKDLDKLKSITIYHWLEGCL
jgi:hypothetical protein